MTKDAKGSVKITESYSDNENIKVLTHSEQDEAKLKLVGVSLCAILDTAHPRKDGSYTIRLRIIHKRVIKLYTTKLNMSSKEFEQLFNKKKSTAVAQKAIHIFHAIKKAYDIIIKHETFNFNEFEKEFYGKVGAWSNVFYAFDQKTKELRQNNQFGSELAYKNCEKHFKEFMIHQKCKNTDFLSFEVITPQWLKQFENYMLSINKSKEATIGIYLRSFRALYNLAIEKGGVNEKHYPFGNNKYNIPNSTAKKNFIRKDDLSILFHGEPKNEFQEKAKDFWFFSYFCNGMNNKDIAHLTYGQLDDETITFYRQKTRKTVRTLEPVIAFLNDFTKKIIKKYGTNNPEKKDDYIFDIIKKENSDEEKYKFTNNFNKFVAQHFKSYAKSLGINKDITSKWARNSFATNAIINGASIEQVSEAFSHSDIRTTKNYFKGFPDDAKRELSKKLLDI